MNRKIGWLTAAAVAVLSFAARAETDTVLVCYPTNVMRFAVEDGVWTAQQDFAHTNKLYGGLSRIFYALASDGRRVFVGESARILEFDMDGNYIKALVNSIPRTIEHMGMSHDARWIYALAGVAFSAVPTNTAVVYRYDATTGQGGEFIPNEGTNALGVSLWKFQTPRGIASDDEGNVWVGERSTGKIYKFSETDGAYLGEVTGTGGVQGLYYAADEKKLYATTSGSASYIIDTVAGTAISRNAQDINNRLAITRVQGELCSGRWGTDEIAGYDLNAQTRRVAAVAPKESRQLITLPRTPLRERLGHLLIAETASNRVIRAAVDSGYAVDAPETLIGGAGAAYDGTPLRSPRGLATFGDTVYVAEGVAGGRVLRFSKWGTFRGVVTDFSQTDYPTCMPAALALSPDGQSLYVSDAHTLFLAGNNVDWANVPHNGYYSTNTYGETLFKIALRERAVSVFADSSSLAGDSQLLEPQGLAVDGMGNVYCTAWFNKATSLSNATGYVYRFNPAGTRTGALSGIGNPSACYYDPSSVYSPAAANANISGPGILFTGNGMQDFWWIAANGAGTMTNHKMLDLGHWRNYLDMEVLDGRMWFTDPEYGLLLRRTGENARSEVLTGLGTPTYMTYVTETGPEPPAIGTILTIR